MNFETALTVGEVVFEVEGPGPTTCAVARIAALCLRTPRRGLATLALAGDVECERVEAGTEAGTRRARGRRSCWRWQSRAGTARPWRFEWSR